MDDEAHYAYMFCDLVVKEEIVTLVDQILNVVQDISGKQH